MNLTISCLYVFVDVQIEKYTIKLRLQSDIQIKMCSAVCYAQIVLVIRLFSSRSLSRRLDSRRRIVTPEKDTLFHIIPKVSLTENYVKGICVRGRRQAGRNDSTLGKMFGDISSAATF